MSTYYPAPRRHATPVDRSSYDRLPSVDLAESSIYIFPSPSSTPPSPSPSHSSRFSEHSLYLFSLFQTLARRDTALFSLRSNGRQGCRFGSHFSVLQTLPNIHGRLFKERVMSSRNRPIKVLSQLIQTLCLSMTRASERSMTNLYLAPSIWRYLGRLFVIL